MRDYDVVVAGGGPSGAAAATIAAKRGIKVLLIEQGSRNREKPCGGLMPPVAEELIEEIFGSEIPESVRSTPRELGLYYSPPSGFRNGGAMKNYRLINVDRPLLDEWLRGRAESFGVDVEYDTEFVSFKESLPGIIDIRRGGGSPSQVRTRFLVGADGVFSMARRQLFGVEANLIWIAQEKWVTGKNLDSNFYVFLDGQLTDAYGYAMPKGGFVKIGLGTSNGDRSVLEVSLSRFRQMLSTELGIQLQSMIRGDTWAIPNGFVKRGRGNILLVGDAAGFCNPFSGEGIRLGMQSGESAGQSIADSITENVEAETEYAINTKQLERLVKKVHKFSSRLTDKEREDFVRTELSRTRPS